MLLMLLMLRLLLHSSAPLFDYNHADLIIADRKAKAGT
jgi:hypothetical protein